MRTIGTIGTVTIFEQDDGSVTFTAGATIDGDGANGQYGGFPCYAPSTYLGRTLDILANAGHPGNWFGVVTDTGLNTGTPILQGPTDPCPGAYVSSTSLNLFAADGSVLTDSSPFKYVDAATVPYISVPLLVIKNVTGIVLGCRCVVTNTTNGQSVVAVVADTGGSNHIGEISIACATAIDIPIGTTHPANGGGVRSPSIEYHIFPGIVSTLKDINYPLQMS